MRIINEIKLDFKDVLILPKRSTLESRSQVCLERTYHFRNSNRHWTGIPIMISNMDTTGTFSMAQVMSKLKILTCIHKFYSINEWIDFLKTLESDQFNHIIVSSGIADGDFEKLDEILTLDERLHWICLDVANGYTDDFVNCCNDVRNKFGSRPIIMAGNVCTPEMVQELILHGGVDIVKVGIGPGSACTTRLKTGIGFPQLSAISECSHAAHGLKSGDKRLGLICADGGCRTSSDIVKAFAANADFVMIGGMLAGTEQCEGEWEYEYKYDEDHINVNGLNTPFWQPQIVKNKISLKFYGMSSHEAQQKYGGIKNYRASEGRVITVPYKGCASNVLDDIAGGIRSACAYVGANSLKDLPKCAEFIRVNRTHFDRSL